MKIDKKAVYRITASLVSSKPVVKSMLHPEEEGEGGFNIYSLTITLLLSIFLAIISTYIALKISALPWPIVFSVVVSMALIKAIKKQKATTHEINVAQAGGTIG